LSPGETDRVCLSTLILLLVAIKLWHNGGVYHEKTRAVRARGAAISINAEPGITRRVRVFDMTGRQLYRRMVTGSAAVRMNKGTA
jgi:hypothetical protein